MMSKKAILVLDEMPKNCVNCPCFQSEDLLNAYCGKSRIPIPFDVNGWCKPDWCPLQESLVGEYEGEQLEPTERLRRLRGMIASLPDDGTVMIQITRNYPDRSNHDNALVKGFMQMGKVVVLQCETVV